MLNNKRDRYSRQIALPEIGEHGQKRIEKGSIVIIGCGALGCNIANLLARAGVGRIRIIDRDFVEYHNLQRQVLFNEDDVKNNLPKVVAAKRALEKVNQFVRLEAIIADVNYGNIERYCSGMDLILDGLDNIETRFLVNDVSLKLKIPYIYGDAIASTGMSMTIIPGETPCFRCVFPSLPEPETLPNCEIAGILASAPAIIGAIEASEAIKILMGSDRLNRDLIMLDVWNLTLNSLKIKNRDGCTACAGEYEFLNKKPGIITTSLCGQSRAIQVTDNSIENFNLYLLGLRLQINNLFQNEYMLRFDVMDYEITIFGDGRAIIKNTLDESVARELYQKYVLDLV